MGFVVVAHWRGPRHHAPQQLQGSILFAAVLCEIRGSSASRASVSRGPHLMVCVRYFGRTISLFDRPRATRAATWRSHGLKVLDHSPNVSSLERRKAQIDSDYFTHNWFSFRSARPLDPEAIQHMGGRISARSPMRLDLVAQRVNARCAEYRKMSGARKTKAEGRHGCAGVLQSRCGARPTAISADFL